MIGSLLLGFRKETHCDVRLLPTVPIVMNNIIVLGISRTTFRGLVGAVAVAIVAVIYSKYVTFTIF